MNRSVDNVFSAALPKERQGEVYHRYVLAVYEMMESLVQRYPDLLFESCSGGGGRFEAGMLYYSPQIWCSDNTDAIEQPEGCLIMLQDVVVTIYHQDARIHLTLQSVLLIPICSSMSQNIKHN